MGKIEKHLKRKRNKQRSSVNHLTKKEIKKCENEESKKKVEKNNIYIQRERKKRLQKDRQKERKKERKKVRKKLIITDRSKV